MAKPSKPFTLDPKMFISGPYLDCPHCKVAGSFGVLMIGGNRYTRRCKECWHSKAVTLPKLHKKIIYLDQFAISEMMKAINAKLGKTAKVDPFWLKLFERLEGLLSKQLIICPDSHFHEQESLMSDFASLRRMYEHLSHGTTFFDPATIKRFQISVAFRKLLGTAPTPLVELDAQSITHGRINDWREKFRISVNFSHSAEGIDAIRRYRSASHAAIERLSERWRTETTKSFQDRYREEALSYGTTIIERYVGGIAKYAQAGAGQLELTGEELLGVVMSDAGVLMTSLQMHLPSGEGPGQHRTNMETIVQFLRSDALCAVPFNHISALLWAGVANRIANDTMRKAPNRGMVNDIEMVSTLLPYCDAMFVDNDLRSLLDYPEVRDGLTGISTRVFSSSNRDAFLEYLENIERSADPAILAAAREVYGDAGPFVTMYERDEE